MMMTEQVVWNQDLVCLCPPLPELDSIVTVRSQINLREVQETERCESVMNDILDLVSEPSGRKELRGDLSSFKPRVEMSSRTMKISRSTPKIADPRVYDETI